MKLKSYGAVTHQGPYLEINEDDVDIDLGNNLYMIFDGFGGSGVGDKAVKHVKEKIKTFYGNFTVDPDSTMPFYYSYKYLLEGNALLNAMQFAHTSLKKENSGKEMSTRGGASASCMSLADNILTISSVGNVKGFLIRNGEISTLVKPDILHKTNQDNFNYFWQTSPLSGFGLFENLHCDITEIKVNPNDQVLFLTDGAYSRLTNDEIKFIISNNNLEINDKIKEVFQLANKRGNLDNQSTIYLGF